MVIRGFFVSNDTFITEDNKKIHVTMQHPPLLRTWMFIDYVKDSVTKIILDYG